VSLASAVERLEDRTLLSTNPIIAGDYTINGKTAHVQQSGDALTFINENGNSSAGQFLSPSRVQATGWGGLSGTLNNGNIDWANGTTWVKKSTPPPAPTYPDISGSYTFNGKGTSVAQNGGLLSFTNENGNSSAGTFINNNTQVQATNWGNLVGTLNNGNIVWANGSTWVKGVTPPPPTPTYPDISGSYTFNGKGTSVAQNGGLLSFTNENGGKSSGNFINNNTQVQATNWGNLVGTLSNGNIVWANGSTWVKGVAPPPPTPTYPDISGSYTFNGKATHVTQSGSSLTFTNENGGSSAGTFNSDYTQVVATNWGGLVGTLSNGNIVWANGSTWVKGVAPPPPTPTYPDISGSYTFNGKATHVAQSGTLLSFTNENGGSTPGKFLSDTQVEATNWGLVGNLVNGNIVWANGSTWVKVTQVPVQTHLEQILTDVGTPLQNGEVTHQVPAELLFQFTSGVAIDPTSLGGIQIVRSGLDGVFGNGNDVVVSPSSKTIGVFSNEVRVQFAGTLPDDYYKITIFGTGSTPLKSFTGTPFNGGVNVTRVFQLNHNSQIISVDPPVSESNQITVHFANALDPATAVDPQYYQLVDTKGTTDAADDSVTRPVDVAYAAATQTAVLDFASIPAGSYQLQIGDPEASTGVPVQFAPTNDDDSSFLTSGYLGELPETGAVISSQIETQGITPPPSQSGIAATVYYNFESTYGADAQGNALINLINEQEKARARETFEVYGFYLGVQFVETQDQGITVVTGDLRAVDPALAVGPGGPTGAATGGLDGLVVIDVGDGLDDTAGGAWFQAALNYVGGNLSRAGFNLSPASQFFAGQQTLAQIRRGNSSDIDLYEFNLASSGMLSAEVFAQRLGTSGLDPALTLFGAFGNSMIVADNSVGLDSAFQVALDAGTYYIGVSSAGNLGYNPAVSDSGTGGTTLGQYELHLDFAPVVFATAAGPAVDADVDGIPGGIFTYEFQTRPVLAGDYAIRGATPDSPDFNFTVRLSQLSGSLNVVSTRVEQSGNSLTFVDENGNSSPGVFVGRNQVVATGFGNLVGTLYDNGIAWSNGVTWYKLKASTTGGGSSPAAPATTFQLVQILPNIDGPLQDGDIRHTAPNELVFRFSPGEAIDPTSLSGIQIVRSGLDGTFGDGNEVIVKPGFVGIGDQPYEVIFRFAENLPDDVYQIMIAGAGGAELNVPGQGFTGAQPPDANGDVGLDYFIQAVNGPNGSEFTIYNKSDGSVATLSDGVTPAQSILFSSLDPAGATSFSDPVVLYDQAADQWLLADLADFNTLNIFISQTNDVTDNLWFHYTVTTPDPAIVPDYPKFAVWNDAYYVTTNEADPTTFEPTPAIYALDRANMLINGTVRAPQRFADPSIVNPLAGFTFQALTPADFDGAAPPPGSPAYFMRHNDDEAHNPGASDLTHDFLQIWQLTVDFDNPANSSLTQLPDIAISEFDSDLNGLTGFDAFPQPGTNILLDPLREVIMNRLQYRNFGSYETLVGNFVTDVDGFDHGGVRWFELRKTGSGDWTLYQEGDIAPDAENRWMGGIAMDGNGNIMIGYNVTSSTVSPGIRYTGRLATDPLGTMFDERVLVNGTGFNAIDRWGDYSSMSIDPSDDSTFWFTGEYANGTGTWSTRIGAFSINTLLVPEPLRSQSGLAFNGGADQVITFELDLGAQVVAVDPQPVLRNQLVTVASAASVADADAVAVTVNGQTVVFELNDLNVDNAVAAGHVQVDFTGGVDTAPTIAAALATAINNAAFGVTATPGGGMLTLSGASFSPSVVVSTRTAGAITRAAGGLVQRNNQIVVHFNQDTLDQASAENPAFYQLINTQETLDHTDDTISNPTSVAYDPVANTATLTFAADLPAATYRLRVGVSDTPVTTTLNVGAGSDNNSTFLTANTGIGVLSGSAQIVINAQIQPQPIALPPLPGGTDEPGHREIPIESHFGSTGTDPVFPGQITTVFYNFQDLYGTDPQGNILHNEINEDQKQRTREIFELLSYYLGIEAVETESQGLIVVTGDLRAVAPLVPTGPGGVGGISEGSVATGARVVMDNAEAWNDEYGASWFRTALHEISHSLGLGHSYDLTSIQGAGLDGNEPVFTGDVDFEHLMRLWRPDATDIDLYRFQLVESGLFTAETFAERLPTPSLLNSALSLFRSAETKLDADIGTVAGTIAIAVRDAAALRAHVGDTLRIDNEEFTVTGVSGGTVTANRAANGTAIAPHLTDAQVFNLTRGSVVARNDDYYSNDSYLELTLNPGMYFVGVTSTGNLDYNPEAPDTGSGGTTDGQYQLRLNFQPTPQPGEILVDATGTRFDGDADGVPGGTFDFWFQATNPTQSNTVYVDKASTSSVGAVGSITNPYREIDLALAAVTSRNQDGSTTNDVDIIRIVGNGGADGLLSTPGDAVPYLVGVNDSGGTLVDGRTFIIPKGVTVMIDQGAVLKLQKTVIDVGSSSVLVNRHNAALQILGTPENRVVLTSFGDDAIGGDTDGPAADGAHPGDWGGVVFRADSDIEEAGVFLNAVYQADLSYGGGQVLVDSVLSVFNPIHVLGARPTVAFDDIRHSADSAVSANLASFEDTIRSGFVLDIPGGGATIADGDRLTIVDNTGLTKTFEFNSSGSVTAGNVPINFFVTDTRDVLIGRVISTVNNLFGFNAVMVQRPGSGRIDVTAILAINEQSNGMAVLDRYNRDATLTRIGPDIHGNLLTSNSINGLFINVPTLFGVPTEVVDVGARFDDTDITHVITENVMIDGGAGGAMMFGGVMIARESGRLRVDANTVVKLAGARIEAGIGNANLIVEGNQGTAGTNELSANFTSIFDDRYGRGGTFDTNDDDGVAVERVPLPGDWGGLILNAASGGSIDQTRIEFGGGLVPIEGQFDSFNVIEVTQADFRLANSRLESNAGVASQTPRTGRGFNDATTVFIRGAQPVIYNNVFLHNEGSVASVNANAMSANVVRDLGRSTGFVAAASDPETGDLLFTDNTGPLVRMNRFEDNAINGLRVRGEELTTETIWDDVDIVHALFDEITINNFHTFGGLRLKSAPNASLVIKLQGADAGITANGNGLDINDRIGGTLQVIGQPLYPVVMSSLLDDTVGAGFDFNGLPQNDTNNDGSAGSPSGPGFSATILPSPGTPFAVTPNTNASQIVGAMLLKPLPAGVSISGATLVTGPVGTGIYDGGDTVPLQIPLRGAILTTGNAVIPNSNTAPDWDPGLGAIMNTPPDPDLDALIPASFTAEATVLTITIDVDPTSGIQSGGFLFQFGSDEYSEFVGSINDVVGGFINGGAATNFMHDALGNLVSISSALFDIDNETTPTLNIEYDGMTRGLLATFPLQPGTNTLKIAIGDALDQIYDSGILLTDLQFSTQPVGAGGISTADEPAAGAWRSLRLEAFSNDRNVAVANELERASLVDGDINRTPESAQFLGELSVTEKSADENRRAGFEVHGFISQNDPGDVDIYSFNAFAGTEVWLDVDRTQLSLNTVLELVDPLGNVLAQSINNDALSGLAFPLVKDELLGGDFYTSNPNDAGMRVVLPGNPGTLTTYYVRVHSFDVTGDGAGDTFGEYQLQIRLRQQDEHPGSTIRSSDIRFATNGVEVLGMPAHSPLSGDTADRELSGGSSNNTTGTAQRVGNVLDSDRASIAIAGRISVPSDVDVFQFEVTYEDIQAIAGFSNDTRHAAIVFDMDYADGLARANTSISIFDASDHLVFTSTDSNVSEDRPAPGDGGSFSDLSRGSVGALDPYIGPIELVEGTYYAVVHNSGQVPQVLDQYFNENTSSPLTRLEPVDSVVRIVEDHIEGSTISTAFPPVVPELINTFNPFNDQQSSIVPYNLGDIVLFVSQDLGTNTTTITTVDPFTGQRETIVGTGTAVGSVHDIILRGLNLMGFSLGPDNTQRSDSNTGHLIAFDTGNGAAADLGDDGILTFIEDPANPGTAIRANANGANGPGVGIDFEAITNTAGIPDSVGGGYFAVGSRGDAQFNPNGIASTTNLLYQFDSNGVALSIQSLDRTGNGVLQGAGTQIVERGELDTFSGTQVTVTEATVVDLTFPLPSPMGTDFSVLDGLTFVVNLGFGAPRTYELNAGIDTRLLVDPNDMRIQGVPRGALADGTTFQITNGAVTDTYELDLFSNGVVAGRIPVVITPGMTTAAQVAAAVAAAINGGATNGVTADAFDDRVALLGGTFLNVDSGLSLAAPNVIGDGAFFLLNSDTTAARPTEIFQFDTGFVIDVGDGQTIRDGDTITITDNNGLPIVFEFNNAAIDPAFTPGFFPIAFNSTDTNQDVINTLIGTVNSLSFFNAFLTQTPGTNRVTSAFTNQVVETSADGLTVVATAGVSPIIQSVSAPALRPGTPDGATFTLQTSSSGVTQTFEVDFTPPGTASFVPGNIPVFVTAGQNAAAVAQALANTINSIDGIGIQVDPLGGAMLVDGDVFSITTANGTEFFELDSNASATLSNVINFTPAQNSVTVAQNIAAAINAGAIGATATVVGDRVVLGGPDVRFSSVGIQGVDPATLSDGDTFFIDTANGRETFELDFNGSVTTGIAVDLSAAVTPADVANAIAQAINGGSIGATATVVGDRVYLGGPSIAFTDVSTGLAATALGGLTRAERFGATGTAIGNRLVVSGADIVFGAGTTVLLDLTAPFDPDAGGPLPVLSPVNSIRIAETNTADAVGQAIRQVVENPPGPAQPNTPVVLVGTDGARVNFVRDFTNPFIPVGGATAIDVSAVFDALSGSNKTLMQHVDDINGNPSAEGVANFPNNIVQVDFLAEDTGVDIATLIETLMTTPPAPPALPASVAVSRTGNVLTIDATVSGDPPFIYLVDAASEGEITGLAVLNGVLFAVSDAGILYRIQNPGIFAGGNAQLVPIGDVGGLGIDFQGLAVMPQNVENNLYRGLLMGISSNGVLYAFDTDANLMPAFVDGRTSVNTGLTSVNGLAFSNLDRNLWTQTGARGGLDPTGNPGDGTEHGLFPSVDLSRVPQPLTGTWELGGGSLAFAGGNYNFAGGAHGSTESGLFSLEGYSAADQPVLYFTYFLETEDINVVPTSMRDSMRVFISGDNGIWYLLATNDLTGFSTSPNVAPLFEFEDPDPNDNIVVNVQPLFDSTGNWRQARVDLSPFVGQKNLKLRFDFSTAGDMNTGDTQTTGDELRALPGFELRDGDTFSIDGINFEFEQGITIVTPTGAQIQDGQTLTVDGTIFEFNSVGGIAVTSDFALPFNAGMTAEEVAQLINDEIFLNLISVTPIKPDQFNFAGRTDMPELTNRVNLVGATVVSTTAPIDVEGAVGLNDTNAVPVPIDASFERYDLGLRTTFFTGSNVPNVRDAMRIAIADTFALGQNSGNIAEVEPNDGIRDPVTFVPLSQDIDAQTNWVLTRNGLIGDQNNINTSTTIPHVTIDGTGNGTFDYYRFTVRGASATNPVQGIFDIDFGETPGQGSMDTELFLYDSFGNLLDSDDDGAFLVAEDPGSTTSPNGFDAFLQYNFTSDGTYVIGVGEFSSTGDPGGITGNVPDPGDTYTLQVSIENHPYDKSGDVQEVEPNNSLAGAQNVDDPNIWSLAPSSLIADINNVPTAFPHISINGSGGQSFDYYSFNVAGASVATPKTGIFDVDFADPPGPQTVNTQIFVYNQSGVLIASNDDKSGPLDPGSSSTLDSFLQFDFTVDGTYIIGIAEVPSVGAPGGITGNNLDPGEDYTLHIALQDHPTNVQPPPAGNVDAIKVYKETVRVIGHNVDDAGPLGLTNQLQGDQFGNFNSNLRGQNNAGFEGAYIDDIVIGFAERGEMATMKIGTPGNPFFIANPTVLETDIAVGDYQLEIRRTDEYGVSLMQRDPGDPGLGLFNSIDTNDRLAAQVTFVAPSGVDIFDGQTFRLSNTYKDSTENPIVTFEYVDLAVRAAAAPDHFPIFFNVTDSAATIAARIRDAINSTQVHNVLNARASISDGTGSGFGSTSNLVNVYGNPAGDVNGSFDFGDIPVIVYDAFGDQNLERRTEQGVINISGNRISNVSEYGIRVDTDQRDPVGSLSHPGAPRALLTLNFQQIAPAAIIQNNVISNFGIGGILFSGDANAAGVQDAVVPFGKIVNNSLYGGNTPTGTGIEVTENASPTILNNIVANTANAITIDNSSRNAGTVVGTTVFQNNGDDGIRAAIELGSNAIELLATAPLFVDAAGGNFYLAEGSRAIDSSLNRLADRPSIVGVKSPLGILPSDIFAPDVDVFGQLRVDDPLQSPPPGLGFQVFKDRGAIERADFVGPTSQLIVPLDQGPRDFDPDLTEVLTTVFPTEFVVKLFDVGIGINDVAIQSNQFELSRDGVPLVPGRDYLFVYNANSDEVTFRSTLGPFGVGVYTIDIDNTDARLDGVNGVRDLAGLYLQPNQANGTVMYTIALGSELSVDDVSVVEGDSGQVAATFTVSLTGPSETPVTVDVSTADGTATLADNDYDEVPLTTLTFLPGGPLSQTVTVMVNGDTVGEPDETFFLNLTNANNARIADAQGVGTIVNDDPPSISIDDVIILEPDGGTSAMAVFTVSLSNPADPGTVVTVDFMTADGTATAADNDYISIPTTTLTFLPGGPLTQQVSVQINGDSIPEGDETFFVVLFNEMNASILDGTGQGTITDSHKPVISINDVSVPEGDIGQANFAVFTVTMSQPTTREIRVNYATSNGTGTDPATAGVDYTAKSGTLVFSVGGALSQQILVPIIADTVLEPNETFVVTLTTTTASLAKSVGQATIIDSSFGTRLAAGTGGDGSAAPLQQSQLDAIIAQAIVEWDGVLGVNGSLGSVTFQVEDLPGDLLGLASSADGSIRIDVDAAGYGWFIDATPGANEEFAFNAASGQYEALVGPAAGTMDLYTLVLHELGHILGLGDLDPSVVPNDLMTETQSVGIRQLPNASHAALIGATAPASDDTVAVVPLWDFATATTGTESATDDLMAPQLPGLLPALASSTDLPGVDDEGMSSAASSGLWAEQTVEVASPIEVDSLHDLWSDYNAMNDLLSAV
jgi:Calx-beta domain